MSATDLGLRASLKKREKVTGTQGVGVHNRVQPQDLDAEDHLLVVNLVKSRRLPLTSLTGQTNARVDFRLDVSGESLHGWNKLQKQVSSTQYSTTDPQWSPPERFEFIVHDVHSARLILTISDQSYCGIDRSRCLASVRVKSLLETLETRGIHKEVSMVSVVDSEQQRHLRGVEMDLPLYSEKDGSEWPGASITVQLSLTPKPRAFRFIRDAVWEYTKLAPNSPSPTDEPVEPGKYADETVAYFGSFSEVAPAVPPMYDVVEEWFVESNGTSGWNYAWTFWSKRWLKDYWPAATYARRRWIRVLKLKEDADPTDLEEVIFHALPDPPDPVHPPVTVGLCLCCITISGY